MAALPYFTAPGTIEKALKGIKSAAGSPAGLPFCSHFAYTAPMIGVCNFCGERLRYVDYYGLRLCGCVTCNTWECDGVPAAMATEDCAALRDQSPQEQTPSSMTDAKFGYMRGRDKFKRDG